MRRPLCFFPAQVLKACQPGNDIRFGPSAVNGFFVMKIVAGMVEIVIQLAGNFFPSPDRRKKLPFVSDSVRIMTVKMSEQETGQKIVPVTVPRRTGLVQIKANSVFFVKMGR
jgi:hypothetical protein